MNSNDSPEDRSRRAALVELLVVCNVLWALLVGFFLLWRHFRLPAEVMEIGMFIFGGVAVAAVRIVSNDW